MNCVAPARAQRGRGGVCTRSRRGGCGAGVGLQEELAFEAAGSGERVACGELRFVEGDAAADECISGFSGVHAYAYDGFMGEKNKKKTRMEKPRERLTASIRHLASSRPLTTSPFVSQAHCPPFRPVDPWPPLLTAQALPPPLAASD